MLNRKGEISTIVILGTLVVIGVAALMSSTLNNSQRTLDTRADFDGTSCNDDIGDILDSSGNTSFNVTCSGNLDKPSTYVFFWCPELSKGASYCGDVRDIKGSKAQVLTQKQGATVPNTYQSTDKTCGCVSWQVGVQNAAGEMGFAGAGLICSENACTEKETAQPTNTSNTQNNSNSSGSSVVSTPTPLLGAIARMATSAPTPTQTQGFLKQSGSQITNTPSPTRTSGFLQQSATQVNTPTPRQGVVALLATSAPTPTQTQTFIPIVGNFIPTPTISPTTEGENLKIVSSEKITELKLSADKVVKSCYQDYKPDWDSSDFAPCFITLEEFTNGLNK